MVTFVEDHAMSPDQAALAVAALHLDDSPVPSKVFEKAVRERSRQFAKKIRRLKGDPDAVHALAAEAVGGYRDLAKTLGETYYVTRWDKALSQT
jgi:hypothetical protein